MTYIIKDMFGNEKARVITLEEWGVLVEDTNKALKDFKEDLSKIKESMEALEERFEDLENKKTEAINKELQEFDNKTKTFKKEIENIRKRIIQNTKEMEERSKTLKQEQTNLQKQLIKNLNSEYLKKLDKQIKPEDIDTLKVLEEYYNKSRQGLKEEEVKKFIEEINDTTPRLNLNAKIKFRLLQVRNIAQVDEDKKYYLVSLEKILREIVDKLRAGMEIKDISISTEEITKGQEGGEDIYGE